MSQTTEIGDIAIPVGFYEKSGEITRRYRRIGSLMQTTRDDGNSGFWVKLNVEVLQPSLLIPVRQFMEKGSDQILLSVFDKDESKQPRPEAPADPDL